MDSTNNLESLSKFLSFIEGNGYDLNGMLIFGYINEQYVAKQDDPKIYRLAHYFKCPLVLEGIRYTHVLGRGIVYFVSFTGFISSQETEHQLNTESYTWDEMDMILSDDKNKEQHLDIYNDFQARANESYFCRKRFVIDSAMLDKLLKGFVVNYGTRLLQDFL